MLFFSLSRSGILLSSTRNEQPSSAEPGGRVCSDSLSTLYAQRKKEKDMLTLLFVFPVLMILALVALRRGADSSDGIDSTEWERRQRLFWLSLKLSHV